MSVVNAQIHDLGAYGNTYEIKEKSFKDSIKEGILDLNVTALKENLLKSVDNTIMAKYALPLSDKKDAYIRKNLYTVPYDIFSLDGILTYRKGEKILSPMPQNMEMSLCFVDASYPELIPFITAQFGTCIYFISNNRLDKNYPSIMSHSKDGRIYPITKQYVKRFGVERTPTKIILKGDSIHYLVLNFKKMLKDYAAGELK